MITLVDESRQWFKSAHGITLGQTDRSIAFCAHTIQGDTPLIVEDASKDPRFRDNPLVTGEPGIRFYAGVPPLASSGEALGAFAVIDRVPRQLRPAELEMLQALAGQVMSLLALRLERNLHRLTAARLAVAQRIGQMGSWELYTGDGRLDWSDEIYRIFGVGRAQFDNTFDSFLALVHPQDRPDLLQAQARALSGDVPLNIVHRIVRPDASVRYVRERAILLPDDAQGGKRLSGMVQDVTEQTLAREALNQRQAELQSVNEQLRLSEERSRYVAQATVDTIWDWNLLNGEVWWNSGMRTQFGYASGEIEPDASFWTQRIHPDDRQGVLDSIHARRPVVGVAIGLGAVFGLVVYFISFYGMTAIFPWFAQARGWVAIIAHLVYGAVLGWVYVSVARKTVGGMSPVSQDFPHHPQTPITQR